MAKQIVMPQLGLTMTEGAVTSWAKQPGERIEKGEVLFTVDTDKVEMEVESTATGYLQKVLVTIGQVVGVATPIAIVGDTPEVVDQPLPASAAPVNGKPANERGALASPRARKLAKELGVDLLQVSPSRGPRIVEEDVRLFHERAGKAPAASPAAAPAGPKTSRDRIAERLSASFREVPHFYLAVEVNASELVRLRTHTLEPLLQRTGERVTYTDLFLMALAKSLAEHGGVNSFWRDGTIIANTAVHVGVAVQAKDSLLVPVIRNADKLNLEGMVRQRSSLAAKARSGSLTLPELEGGSATLSNLGQYDVDWFQAIVNPPQSVIVATGRIAKKPAVVNDRVESRESLTVTLSADHRVVDGVAAAQFLTRLKALLENPYALIV